MIVTDLGQMPYRQAWAAQEAAHAAVVAGGPENLLLVEHAPVITFGRRPGGQKNLVADSQRLAEMGVELVQSDRGGDITFHGPGQLVAYPIVRLLDHGLSVGAYMQRLQDTVIATLAEWGVIGTKDSTAIGVWVEQDGQLSKICALGVRIRRGVSLHGIAINVSIDLRYFDLIIPCGLPSRPVTSLEKLLGSRAPGMDIVKASIARQFARFFPSR